MIKYTLRAIGISELGRIAAQKSSERSKKRGIYPKEVDEIIKEYLRISQEFPTKVVGHHNGTISVRWRVDEDDLRYTYANTDWFIWELVPT